MKHVVLAVLVLALLGAAGAALWFSRHTLTTPVLAFSGGALLLAIGLAAPMNLGVVLDKLSNAKLPKIGGTP